MAVSQQYYYKIVLLGDAGVGKTSLFGRIKTGRFNQTETTVGTGGADQCKYTTTIGDDSINVSYVMMVTIRNVPVCMAPGG